MTAGVNPVSIGPVAAEILAHDGDAEIAAVFERSFYVLTRHGYVAAGSHALGDGPLNILLDANLGTVLRRKARGVCEASRYADNFELRRRSDVVGKHDRPN